MPISHKYKAIFVHVPKTGGTSIHKFLKIPKQASALWGNEREIRILFNNRKFVLHHAPIGYIKHMYPEIFDDYFKFGFVRNPYDRVISEYRWHHRKEENRPEEVNDVVYFSKWIREFYEKDNIDHKCTQKCILYYNDVLLMDKVYKYEDFQESIEEIKLMLGAPELIMEHHNKSERQVDKEKLLNEENKEFIYNKFKEDFDTFEYDK